MYAEDASSVCCICQGVFTIAVPWAIFSLEDIQMILALEFDAREWVFLSQLFGLK